MSECMTIADFFAAEEKYSDEGVTTAKDIVQSILTDALHSVIVNTDKVSDSNRIGDCNVEEETGLPEIGLRPGKEESGESCQSKRSEEEERSKEYKVIKDQALADSELRIENGKILLQPNGAKPAVNLSNIGEICQPNESGQEKPEESSKSWDNREDGPCYSERPFTPFTTEDVRKSILEVWKNVNTPAMNGWNGEMVNQPQEVVRLMEELAAIQVTPNSANSDVDDSKKEVEEEEKVVNFEDNNSKEENKNSSSDQEAAGIEEKKEHEAEDGEELQVIDIESSSTSVIAFNSDTYNKEFQFDPNEDIMTVALTESDEAFIDSNESVIQIIDPHEEIAEENEDETKKITFSLFNERYRGEEAAKEPEVENQQQEEEDDEEDDVDRQEEYEKFQKCYSGMTTVGPIKNCNYDPKLLACPKIDYGRMTRITGSRELTKEAPEQGSKTSIPKKILLDATEDTPMIIFEDDYVEFDTIVNHEIASMTKMQKVREVLSDQPKSEEDLRGDEMFSRSPLDLKDVDAESSHSYNVIDIGIPLVTAEILRTGNDSNNPPRTENNTVEPESSGSKTDVTQPKPEDSAESGSSGKLHTGQNQKHTTIGRVFQKASNRSQMKDSDSFLRNSRSLPRDTGKITNTESFRSLIDDCQTSAATVLKKSRSLLRNTQNALKAVSKTGLAHVAPGDKQTRPPEKTESQQSVSCRRKEFLKLKDSLKSKVGKTLKSLENVRASCEMTDQSDYQRKPSPKSHLVRPNQLLRKKSLENRKLECERSLTILNNNENFDRQQENSNDTNENPESEVEVICGVKFQSNHWYADSKGYQMCEEEANVTCSESVDYVMMSFHEDSSHAIPGANENRPKSAAGCLTETGNEAKPEEEIRLGEEECVKKSGPEGKLAKKNKKFSQRIRNFWQSAFGKVKSTPHKKHHLS